jgi:GT2 family glycosyltransferase
LAAVSIVIVNWNSKDLLRQCLLSVLEYAMDLRPQVIVVDGGSFDGCAQMLAAEFPTVEFVQSQENIGFGRANNLGFSKVTGDALLLLNPDADLTHGALQAMLRELEKRIDAGIVGPRLLNTDGSLQTSVQPLPKPVRQAFDSEFLRRVLWPFRLWGPPTDFVPRGTIEVEATSGACMLMWSKTFREVGGFNPQYFMYAEDMDLCLKLARKGLRIYHVPDAKVTHHGGGSSSTQGGAFSSVMVRDALHKYLEINHGPLHAAAYRISIGSAAVLKMPIYAIVTVLGTGKKRLAAKASVKNWWSAFSWSLGREKWVDRYR